MGILKLFLALLFIFLAFDWVGTVGFRANTPPGEVNALKLIGKSLGKTDWNFSVDPCSGMGGWITPPNKDSGFENNVTCNCTYKQNTVCHVVIISLKGQNLAGVLPLELGGLPFLQNLDLTRNFLNGTIPPGWGSSGLVMVSLLGNRLSGHIPTELGNISSLEELIVEANQLSGPVPRELGRLIKLRRLFISSNPLTGQLPEEFARLTKMKDFRMSDTNISGKIPHFIQNWTKLDKLVIQGCPMEGPIPSGISGLNTLTDLRISDISGTGWNFPDLSKMLKMRTLILRNCLISGTIPEYIANMSLLKNLDLSFNNLTGEIPKSFGSLPQNRFMYLTSNMLTGSLPDWILETNKNVDVSYNNLTWGSSGPESCEQGHVNLVESYSSTMNSSVNSCLKKDFPCSGSKYCFLYINCGGKALHINGTKYEEDLKDTGASTSYISENWAFSSTGDFMDNDQDDDKYFVTNISMLSMAHSDLYETARISPLSLTYYALCMINGNYTVKLHFAEIMFTNDATFGSLGRRIFDVYIQEKLVWKDFNIHDEAGGVGKAVVKNFTANVTRNTLEIRFLWAGKGTQSMPRKGVYGPLISAISVVPDFVPLSTGDKKLSAMVTAAIVASVLSVILLVLVILWRAGWLRSKATMENELRGLDLQTGSFTLRQIKAATNNFDPKNKIGEGGFGPVYKGLLANGTIIAVKQLSSKSKQGNREFVNEIGMITALQHPNLVKLYGCCIEGNQLSLIYEYMENNSLARALFYQEEEFPLELDWPTRCKICIGIARGLAYLHEESRLKVVHRDIKTTNILLDKDLNAKISDFGLAKLHEEENSHISTRIAGTLGYMAPEYAMHGYLTDKADVYSFGIVTLEIVSGKSIMNCKPKEEGLYLLDWAIVLQERGNLSEMIDPKLGSNFSMEEAIRILKVAILCTNNSPILRPAMSSVVSMIEGRTVVDDLLSNTSFSADDILFKSIRSHSQQILDHAEIQTQSISIDGPATSSSTSAADLYPITVDSDIWDGKICHDKAIGNHTY